MVPTITGITGSVMHGMREARSVSIARDKLMSFAVTLIVIIGIGCLIRTCVVLVVIQFCRSHIPSTPMLEERRSSRHRWRSQKYKYCGACRHFWASMISRKTAGLRFFTEQYRSCYQLLEQILLWRSHQARTEPQHRQPRPPRRESSAGRLCTRHHPPGIAVGQPA